MLFRSTVSRTYLDWLVALPWQVRTDDVINLKKTKQVLDDDHSGLERPKDRILEYLAVRKLNPDVKGPILCFVGPPVTVEPGSQSDTIRKFQSRKPNGFFIFIIGKKRAEQS